MLKLKTKLISHSGHKGMSEQPFSRGLNSGPGSPMYAWVEKLFVSADDQIAIQAVYRTGCEIYCNESEDRFKKDRDSDGSMYHINVDLSVPLKLHASTNIDKYKL